MAATHYPTIRVSGSAYERGRQHGEQARDRVEASVAIYQAAFSGSAGVSWPEAIERARGFSRLIEAQAPTILDEMRGIADGAGFRLEEIVAVNCRTEILYGGSASDEHECTTIAVTPSASANGSTIVAKNWDWRAACQDSVIVLQAEQEDGPDFVMLVEAGMVGRDGFNEAGIAVCGNLLRSIHDGKKPGVPVPFIRRRVLDSARLDSALSAVLDAERAASTNYLIAHESGIVINFEASPEQVYPVYPERGLLTHSNHFTAVAAEAQGIGLFPGTDTLYRNRRAWDLLEPKIGQITVEDVKAALRDHVGHPRSICRHRDDSGAPEDFGISIASIVIDLGERVMWVASGPPCEHDYQPVRLPADAALQAALIPGPSPDFGRGEIAREAR